MAIKTKEKIRRIVIIKKPSLERFIRKHRVFIESSIPIYRLWREVK